MPAIEENPSGRQRPKLVSRQLPLNASCTCFPLCTHFISKAHATSGIRQLLELIEVLPAESALKILCLTQHGVHDALALFKPLNLCIDFGCCAIDEHIAEDP